MTILCTCNVHSGKSWGGARLLPLFLDQTEAQKAKRKFFETSPPPALSEGLDEHSLPPPPPSPPSFSEGLDPPLLHVHEVLLQSIMSGRLGPD